MEEPLRHRPPPGNPQTLYSLTLEASDDPEHTKQ
jgi:hypothetical protein